MKRYLRTCLSGLLALLAGSSLLPAQDFPLSPNLWSNPEFQNRFLGSYGFDTSITPKISVAEQEVFKALLPLMESNPAEAARQLRSEISAESSAALDYTLANLYVQIQDLENAERAYETAIRKFPNFFRAYKNLGLVYVNDGRYEEALPLLRRGLELGGTDGALYGPLGLCYLNLDQPASALTAYNQALLFQPESNAWRLGKLRCLMDLGEYADAAGLLEELIQEDSSNGRFWTAQANAYLAQEEFMAASANLEILKRMGQADAASLGLLADIYLSQEMTGLALANYVLAAQEEALNPERLLQVADGLVVRRLWSEAATYLDSIAGRVDGLTDRQSARYLNLRAQTALGMGDREVAAEILEALVRRDPMNGDALLTLGDLQRDREEYEEAAFSYEQAAKVDQTRLRALVQHARMLVSLREYGPAVDLLKRVVLLDSDPRYADFLERVESAHRAAQGRI